MKKLTKLVSLAVITGLIMALFAGCSSTNSAKGSSAASGNSKATNYPQKPIQIIVPAGPGGDTDTNARLIAKYMEKALGKSVVVVNMEGAGGSLGSKKVMDADPDGYTVLFFHSSVILNKIFGVTDYDDEAFEQGPMVTQEPGSVLMVGKNSKFKTLKELVDYGKAHPKEIKYAMENGGLYHMMGLAFEKATGVELNMVDIGGQSAKNAALLGGQVDMSPAIVGNSQSYIKSGDMIPLGILAGERQEAYKDIPTLKEQGVDIDIVKPYYFLLPKGTPKEVVDKFNEGVKKAAEDPGFAKDLSKFYIKPAYKSPEDTKKLLDQQRIYFQDLYNSVKK